MQLCTEHIDNCIIIYVIFKKLFYTNLKLFVGGGGEINPLIAGDILTSSILLLVLDAMLLFKATSFGVARDVLTGNAEGEEVLSLFGPVPFYKEIYLIQTPPMFSSS